MTKNQAIEQLARSQETIERFRKALEVIAKFSGEPKSTAAASLALSSPN